LIWASGVLKLVLHHINVKNGLIMDFNGALDSIMKRQNFASKKLYKKISHVQWRILV
jgi:hypothetical protein